MSHRIYDLDWPPSAELKLTGDKVRVEKAMIGDPDVTLLCGVGAGAMHKDGCQRDDDGSDDGDLDGITVTFVNPNAAYQTQHEEGEPVSRGFFSKVVRDMLRSGGFDKVVRDSIKSLEFGTTGPRHPFFTRLTAQEDIKAGDLVEADLATGKIRRARVSGYQPTQIIADDPHMPEPAKPDPASESVHRAISAMQKPGRANEL